MPPYDALDTIRKNTERITSHTPFYHVGLFFNIYFLNFYRCVFACVDCVWKGPWEAGSRHQDPWSGSYRLL